METNLLSLHPLSLTFTSSISSTKLTEEHQIQIRSHMASLFILKSSSSPPLPALLRLHTRHSIHRNLLLFYTIILPSRKAF